MSFDDECSLLTDSDTVPIVRAIERHASRRGRSWIIDLIVLTARENDDGVVHLRSLATAAGFPQDDDGAVIRSHQIPLDCTGQEWIPMWAAMRDVVRVWALANNTDPGHLEEIEPRWL